jgi:hypothetical protein
LSRQTQKAKCIAGLHGLKDSPEWNDLKAIQNIRNLIAHNDGRLRDRQGKEDAILANMKKLGFLSGQHELRIAEGFLSKVVDACDCYFKRIAEAIDASEGAGQVHSR